MAYMGKNYKDYLHYSQTLACDLQNKETRLTQRC